MTRCAGWRVPSGGGVAHYFEVDGPDGARLGDPYHDRSLQPLCGKVRQDTTYLHPFAGVGGDWRPCRDCFGRVTTILKDVEVEA